jgi:hypothetical protein
LQAFDRGKGKRTGCEEGVAEYADDLHICPASFDPTVLSTTWEHEFLRSINLDDVDTQQNLHIVKLFVDVGTQIVFFVGWFEFFGVTVGIPTTKKVRLAFYFASLGI